MVTYYAADDVPVFLLTVINKGEKANLSKAERNALRAELSAIDDDYRTGLRRKLLQMEARRQ